MTQPNPIPPPTAHADTKKKPKTELQLRLETFQSFIDQPRVTDQLARVLPDNMEIKRQKILLINSLRRTPKILLTTRESLVAAVLQVFELGLSPVAPLGHVYFVPFQSKGQLLCQLIIGYRGLIELARRSGTLATTPRAEVVRRGDYFRYSLGLNPHLEHIPADVLQFEGPEKIQAVRQALAGLPADGKLVAAYAVVSPKNGDKEFRVVTEEFINRIKKASRGSNLPDSPWRNWEDQMWAKTAIRQVLKFVPLSPEDRLTKALDIDESAFTDIGKAPIETTGVETTESETNGSSEMVSVDEALSIESEGSPATGMDAFVDEKQTAEESRPATEATKPEQSESPSEASGQEQPEAPKAQRRRRSTAS
jgi:recombination protein RecT